MRASQTEFRSIRQGCTLVSLVQDMHSSIPKYRITSGIIFPFNISHDLVLICLTKSAMIGFKEVRKLKETTNMPTEPELENMSVNLWRTVYQTYARFKNGMDQVLGEYSLTMEQYLVLTTIKYHDAPMRITDVANWLERSTNSVTMIVDRMVKAGLLRRVRDRRDRRTVNVFLTSKAENAIKAANPAAWEYMQLGMSPLSYKDKDALGSLLKTLNYKLLEYLNPGADVQGMLKSDSKQQDYVMKQWRKQPWLAASKAKRRGTKIRKTR
jgi:DNA-binding MarR family transcriptional regulator